MKIPIQIKEKIRKSGQHNKKAIRLNREVRDWLEARLKEEELNDTVLDQLIDSIELGNNLSDSFIEFLEEYEE